MIIRGRAWADAGVGDGYYALALRLRGASRVVLVDPAPPSPWAAPVLASAGIEVVTSDARSFDYASISGVCLLYVPGVCLDEVVQRATQLEQLVTNDIDDAPTSRRACEQTGWRLCALNTSGAFFEIGEPSAVPGASSHEELWFLSGPAGSRPRCLSSTDRQALFDPDDDAP